MDLERTGVVHALVPVPTHVNFEIVAPWAGQIHRNYDLTFLAPRQGSFCQGLLRNAFLLGADFGSSRNKSWHVQPQFCNAIGHVKNRPSRDAESKLVVKEGGLDYWKGHELLNADGPCEELPVGLVREVLKDVLLRIGQEVELINFVRHDLVAWPLDVTRSPVAVDEAPGVLDPDGRPLVAECHIVELSPRTVACTLGIPFDDLTVQTGITAKKKTVGIEQTYRPIHFLMSLFLSPIPKHLPSQSIVLLTERVAIML